MEAEAAAGGRLRHTTAQAPVRRTVGRPLPRRESTKERLPPDAEVGRHDDHVATAVDARSLQRVSNVGSIGRKEDPAHDASGAATIGSALARRHSMIRTCRLPATGIAASAPSTPAIWAPISTDTRTASGESCTVRP